MVSNMGRKGPEETDLLEPMNEMPQPLSFLQAEATGGGFGQ